MRGSTAIIDESATCCLKLCFDLRNIGRLYCSRRLALLIFSLFFIVVLNLFGCSTANRPVLSDGKYRVVERVIDGDTLVMENGERIRLIGVDTPETKHPKKPVEDFGKEAAAFTKRIVEEKRMRLEFDPATAHRGHKDRTRQRRTLAYVFLNNGLMLNAEIIKQGYGFADTRSRFHGLKSSAGSAEAREQRRGLWMSD